ncbi:peroxidase P7-like [Impatiens glandulifera]|uniref:peroxidase P7-like n=1 Tax=Impatiens glandulifera TaxID=253017 RepID=UPI001FB0FD48|nr:peroxidase P7-like [Impatiens glandulifera]
MASNNIKCLPPLVFFIVATILCLPTARGQLTADFYDHVCPEALPKIKEIVQQAIAQEARIGASLLRIHFHDCFVNGCDGSVLLDDIPGVFTGEKTARPNFQSLRPQAFALIDQIKATVDEVCYGTVVSCADILAVAARDSIVTLGGPSYEVLLGRRDARTASLNDANNDIPSPFSDLSQLLQNFQQHGLTLQDLVVLSGGHTIGLARCTVFRNRTYNDNNIDQNFAVHLQGICPQTVGVGDNNTAPLDFTSTQVDTNYYKILLEKKGLLHSDQELFKGDGSESSDLVQHFANNPNEFAEAFGVSMIKMGNLEPLTGDNGEIRNNCRRVNN